MSDRSPSRVDRADALEKVTGAAVYTEDFWHGPGMLHAKLLLSPHAHARILSVDVSDAERMPGVRAVATGQDVPRREGFMIKDRAPYALDRVRYYGEPVAAVAADTPEIAAAAVRAIRVRYEPLPVVMDPREAASPGATLIHPDMATYQAVGGVTMRAGTNIVWHGVVRKGDATAAFEGADLCLRSTYRMPRVQHVPLENHVATALYGRDGRLTVWASAQGPHQRQIYLANLLGISPQRVRVITPYVGGGFGGKSNVSVEMFVAPLAVKVLGRPVRLQLTREEEFLLSFTRMDMVADLHMAATSEGDILALEADFWLGAGAWADNSLGMADNLRNCVTGAYEITAVRADVYCVYTNAPGGGSFRGYGMPELHWAIESHVDELARRLGLDPVVVRERNGLRTGGELATGGRLHPSGLHECIERVKKELAWDQPPAPAGAPHLKRGRGIAACIKGPHGPVNMGAAAVVKFNADGTVDVMTGAVEMGQGVTTALAQLASAELGVPYDAVRVRHITDTDYSPYDWKSVGSRTTWLVGNAVLAACRDARAKALAAVARLRSCSPESLTVRDQQVLAGDEVVCSWRDALVMGMTDAGGGTGAGPIVGTGAVVTQDLDTPDPATGQAGKVKPYYTMGCQGVEVEVDTETGRVTILKAAAAFDVGHAINPEQVRGQMMGGMLQGLSTAMLEELVFRDGVPRNASLVDYKIITTMESPLQWAVHFVEVPQDDGPFGARGVAEPPIVGAAPALGNALRDALGIRFCSLPLSPERVALAVAVGREVASEDLEEAFVGGAVG